MSISCLSTVPGTVSVLGSTDAPVGCVLSVWSAVVASASASAVASEHVAVAVAVEAAVAVAAGGESMRSLLVAPVEAVHVPVHVHVLADST